MKITGTLEDFRISLTASIPELPSASLDVGEHHFRVRGLEERHRFLVGTGDARDAVTEILHHLLDVERDQRLVLDDHNVGCDLP